MGGKRFYYPADTEAFLRDEAAPVMDGGCGAEDYLILQLRLRKGLSLDEYKKRYGREFSTAQLAFVQNCVKSGYANFDGHTLTLTPAAHRTEQYPCRAAVSLSEQQSSSPPSQKHR